MESDSKLKFSKLKFSKQRLKTPARVKTALLPTFLDLAYFNEQNTTTHFQPQLQPQPSMRVGMIRYERAPPYPFSSLQSPFRGEEHLEKKILEANNE